MKRSVNKNTKKYRLEQEYKKVRAGRQDQIRKMRKRGYDVPDLPKEPDRITEASIRRLKNQYSTEKLYEKSTYTIPETGEVVSGKAGKAYRRREGGKKAAETKRKYRPQRPIETPPEEPEYTPAPEITLDDKYDIMVSKVERMIDEMYPCQKPGIAPACANAAKKDFQDWLTGRSTAEVVAVLEQWDMLEISQRFFDSEDANMFCHQRIVAQHLASISETVRADLSRIEDEGDEFIDVDSDMMYDMFF